MKIIILTPVYNDWQSVYKLIDEINNLSLNKEFEISVYIFNDYSNHDRPDFEKSLENINSIKIFNMKKNQGHARCIATGLKYIFEKDNFDYVIPMDGDGEDRPEEIESFLNQINKTNYYYIPNRFTDGYGSSVKLIKKIITKNPDLIIFVDNGSNSYETIRFLNNNKIKSIIDELVEMNCFQDLIIEELLKYEKERHQKNICECSTDGTCFNDEKTKELFKDFLDYYFVTNQNNYLNKDNRLLN